MDDQNATVEEVKKKLLEVSSSHTDGFEIQFSFISPGHGTKGKQIKVDTDEDLKSMYVQHQRKKRIYFWIKCKPKSGKRSAGDFTGEAPQAKRHTALVEMMTEVDTIVQQLKDKHGQKFSDVQFSCWAHMIHTNKHESLETPPNKPFFGKKESVGVSPVKRISLRSECIDQLDKWSKLMDRGVISSTEYEELQQKIMKDIKNF